MPASQGVNPLVTSHTVEHLSSIYLHSWSHDKTIMFLIYHCLKKSRIRETRHLSTDADSNTDAIGGWTKNTPKPDFFDERKNHQKRKNSEMSRNMTKLAIRPLPRGL